MKFVRAAFLTLAVTAAGFTLATVGADSAMAMCKYGSGDCIDPHPNFDFTIADDVYLPEDNWVDPDCEYYGNCNTNLQTGEADDHKLDGLGSFGNVLRR
jgi:hypothetical protein